MKKFFAFLLTFAMLFSLAMPAMAAEITGNTDNPTEGDVTANYDPTIEITGIKLTGDAVSYDANTDTYTVTIPAGETQVPVTIVVSGKGLEYATDADHNKLIVFGSTNPWVEAKYEYPFTRNDNDGTWTGDHLVSNDIFSPSNIGYTNLGDFSDSVYHTVNIVQAYAITNTTTDTNGTITVPAEAAVGSTVTVSVNPNEGYELDTLTVTDTDGTPVTVENNQFTMPAKAVTVTATFKEAVKTYNVTIQKNTGGQVLVDPYTYTAGQTVTLKVVPANVYKLDTLTVNDGAVEVIKVDDTTYTFVMPEADVTVTVTFKKITYNVNIANGITGGTVSVDKTTAEGGETVTVKVEANAGYAYIVGSLTVTNDTTGETVEVNEEAKTFVMPASAVTVTASFEKLSVTSANIVWGNMSFTYDDTIDENTKAEKGWTPADEEGAGTVTVTNTGDTTFTAQVAYTAEEEYAEITGTFDADSAELKEDEEKTFTLTLKNKPNKAITAGTKIGSVTIEIVNDSGSSDDDEGDAIIVTDEQGLRDAIAQGGKIKLGDSITMASSVDIRNDVTLDLNNKTLTCSTNFLFVVYSGATFNLSNGTISGSDTPVNNYGGTVSVENCTLTGSSIAYYQEGGVSSLRNCIANGEINIDVGGTITLYENITFGHGTHDEAHTGIVTYGGSVICHFDPTGHIKIGSLSDNNDGTWTVTAN